MEWDKLVFLEWLTLLVLDWHDDQGRAGLQRPGQEKEGLHYGEGVNEADEEVIKGGVDEFNGQGKGWQSKDTSLRK